jgi:hypothetical protein
LRPVLPNGIDVAGIRHHRGVLLERLQQCHSYLLGLDPAPCHAIWPLAAATTFSTLKPNFFNSCFIGADAPKLSIQMLRPSQPVYLLQPNGCDLDGTALSAAHQFPVRLILVVEQFPGRLLTTWPAPLTFQFRSPRTKTSLPVLIRMTDFRGRPPAHSAAPAPAWSILRSVESARLPG